MGHLQPTAVDATMNECTLIDKKKCLIVNYALSIDSRENCVNFRKSNNLLNLSRNNYLKPHNYV